MSDAMFEKVRDIIVDILAIDPEEITPEANFRDDLGADSLDLVELMMAFEDESGQRIPDEDARQLLTVGDAVAYIEKRMQEG